VIESELLGFRILAGERIAILNHLWERCKSGLSTHVLTLNPEMVMLGQKDERVAGLLKQADIAVADGVGVEWAATRLGLRTVKRYPGVDLGLDLLSKLAAECGRAFLLGGKPGVAEQAAARLEQNLPGLHITGFHDGYFEQADEGRIADCIAASDSRLLLVGMGCPRQEEFIARHRHMLNTPLMIGVGGALEVYAGVKRRAPMLVMSLRMEWLWRALCDLGRFRRLSSLPQFVWHVLKLERSTRSGRAA
jgi:N-acetylglucosaminyldiphosphoundecaprenol N-acetyl-beta-D-mannosaminyltransferase